MPLINTHIYKHVLKIYWEEVSFLRRVKDLVINVVHIESRKSQRRGSEYDILVDIECDPKKMEQLMKMLSREVAAINLTHEQIGSISRAPSLSTATSFGESFRVTNIDRINFYSLYKTELNAIPISMRRYKYIVTYTWCN